MKMVPPNIWVGVVNRILPSSVLFVNDAGRIADDDCVRSNILRDDGTGTHYGAFADRNAGKDDGAGSDDGET